MREKLTGMQTFRVIWLGQMVSIMGSSMTRFAFIIWAFNQTSKASTTALIAFSSYLPYILISPLAGVIVDRFSRKLIMIVSDLSTGLITLLILLLFVTGKIEIWHLYLYCGFSSLFESFQVPAYTSSITLLLDKKDLPKASGMRSLSSNLSQIAAPILAGVFIGFIGIEGIIWIDLITFGIAMITLMMVFIPSLTKHPDQKEQSILSDIRFGIQYLKDRKGLLYLMFIFSLINLIAAMTYFGILPAMILARTNHNELSLAWVQAALGVGGVVGSIIVSIYGLPSKKVWTIVLSGIGSFLLGDILMGLGQTVIVWCIAAFMTSVFLPILMGAETTLWQIKVDPKLQGRIFSLKSMIQLSMMPLGFLLGGYLADYLFEPMMQSTGVLPKFLHQLVGSGKGSGMSVMFLLSGLLGAFIFIIGYSFKKFRNIEHDLPDFDITDKPKV